MCLLTCLDWLLQGFYFPEKRDGHVMCTGMLNGELGAFMFAGYGHLRYVVHFLNIVSSSSFKNSFVTFSCSETNMADLWFLRVNVSSAFDNPSLTVYSQSYYNGLLAAAAGSPCWSWSALFSRTIHLHALCMIVGWTLVIAVAGSMAKFEAWKRRTRGEHKYDGRVLRRTRYFFHVISVVILFISCFVCSNRAMPIEVRRTSFDHGRHVLWILERTRHTAPQPLAHRHRCLFAGRRAAIHRLVVSIFKVQIKNKNQLKSTHFWILFNIQRRREGKENEYFVDDEEMAKAVEYRSTWCYNFCTVLSENVGRASALFALVNISLGVCYAVLDWYWLLAWFVALGMLVVIYAVIEIKHHLASVKSPDGDHAAADTKPAHYGSAASSLRSHHNQYEDEDRVSARGRSQSTQQLTDGSSFQMQQIVGTVSSPRYTNGHGGAARLVKSSVSTIDLGSSSNRTMRSTMDANSRTALYASNTSMLDNDNDTDVALAVTAQQQVRAAPRRNATAAQRHKSTTTFEVTRGANAAHINQRFVADDCDMFDYDALSGSEMERDTNASKRSILDNQALVEHINQHVHQQTNFNSNRNQQGRY